MSNANRDYVIVYDVKNSLLILNRPLNFYLTDKNTSNIFVKLVTRVIVGDGIDQYTDIENASNYILTMRVIKPNNEIKSIQATQHEPESIFQFDLTEDFKDIPGKYICELTISTMVSSRQELITSDPFSYEVKRSILSNVGEIIETEDTTVEKLLNNLDAAKTELSSQIKEKADKDEVFSMANMGQDIKEAMTGGSVAVVGENMVNESNLNSNCINFQKHSKKYPLISKTTSRNLFNKNDAIEGYYVDRNTGNLVAKSNYFTSDFIYVTKGKYIKNNDQQCAYYDVNKIYVTSGNSDELQDIPEGVSYIRVCGFLSKINTFQFEKGETKTQYEEHIENKKQNVLDYFTEASIYNTIKNNIFEPSYVSSNLFNKNNIIQGYYVDRNTGNLLANNNYFTSDFIEVDGNTQYCKTDDNQFAFYDANKVFISPPQASSAIFTTTNNTKYVRICGSLYNLDEYQLKIGDVIGDYEKYGRLIESEQCAFNTPIISIYSIMSKFILSDTKKKIKLIGDSITHGEGGTGYDNLGEEIMTIGNKTWKVNLGGHCWANSLKEYFEQKLNCEVINYGTSGANSQTIVNGLGQLIDGSEDLVICTIGTNDRHNNSKKTYCNNLKKIYSYCNNRDIDIIFMSNIPSGVASETAQPGKWHMEDCDMLIMKVCTDLNLEYISLYKKFIEYCKYNNVSIDSLLRDGLHPNDTGYDVMFYLISDSLGIPCRREGSTWDN